MRSTALAGVLGAGALMIAACGGGGPKAYNDADVQFAQRMIPHHQQAIEMSDLALANATSPHVIDLASRIKAAQDPEIKQMTGWLNEWGKPVETSDDVSGMDHGSGGDTMGMMTDAEMAQLQAATGAQLDQMFLEMMVRHHEGAIEMAKEAQSEGKFPEARRMADSIVTSQQAEIDEINTLLGKR
jgi:uncharacterized protein (DUF305 family)